MKRFVHFFIAALIILTTGASSGAEARWTEGYGQGNLEYFIDKGNLRLMIGCPTEDGSADAFSSLSLSRLSDHKAAEMFTLHVNGITFEGPFEANSRVGTNNFLLLLEALRKGNAEVRVGNQKTVFPKSNAAKVLPAYGKKFVCNLG